MAKLQKVKTDNVPGYTSQHYKTSTHSYYVDYNILLSDREGLIKISCYDDQKDKLESKQALSLTWKPDLVEFVKGELKWCIVGKCAPEEGYPFVFKYFYKRQMRPAVLVEKIVKDYLKLKA